MKFTCLSKCVFNIQTCVVYINIWPYKSLFLCMSTTMKTQMEKAGIKLNCREIGEGTNFYGWLMVLYTYYPHTLSQNHPLLYYVHLLLTEAQRLKNLTMLYCKFWRRTAFFSWHLEEFWHIIGVRFTFHEWMSVILGRNLGKHSTLKKCMYIIFNEIKGEIYQICFLDFFRNIRYNKETWI